jgi:hypothetical protein
MTMSLIFAARLRIVASYNAPESRLIFGEDED